MLTTCCAYSCTQYSLHTQYILLTHADNLLCLQLHTVGSLFFLALLNFHETHRANHLYHLLRGAEIWDFMVYGWVTNCTHQWPAELWHITAVYNIIHSRVELRPWQLQRGFLIAMQILCPKLTYRQICKSVTAFISLSWSPFAGFLFHSKSKGQIIHSSN